jgi:hypothetical protein
MTFCSTGAATALLSAIFTPACPIMSNEYGSARSCEPGAEEVSPHPSPASEEFFAFVIAMLICIAVWELGKLMSRRLWRRLLKHFVEKEEEDIRNDHERVDGEKNEFVAELNERLRQQFLGLDADAESLGRRGGQEQQRQSGDNIRMLLRSVKGDSAGDIEMTMSNTSEVFHVINCHNQRRIQDPIKKKMCDACLKYLRKTYICTLCNPGPA